MNQHCYTVASAGFEAACRIESLPHNHRASRLHGHSFQAKVRTALPSASPHSFGSEVEELQSHLQTLLAPLDHRYLNDIIKNPTNENIARWLQGRLEVEANKIAVLSTYYEGVDIDHKDIAHVWKQFRFEAAHQLPNVEPGHQCGRMHGHGFKVILHASRLLGDDAMAVDIDELGVLWSSVVKELEYTCLNDIKGLENPTSEILSSWLWQRLKPQMAALSTVSVYETATAGCHFDGKDYSIWKDFRFESALSFTQEKASSDSLRNLHGHSYLARLHLQAPLDAVLGWTIDYGDVKTQFKPMLDLLDHNYLNDINGLTAPSCLTIAKWIKGEMQGFLPHLNRVDCYHSPGCGAVLSWSKQGPSLPI